MEKLAIEFSRTLDGKKIHHKQLKRTDLPHGRCVCIYSLTKEGLKQPYAFEVVVPKLQLKDIPMPAVGYVSKAGEKYPGTNDFGTRALYIGGVGTYDEKYARALEAEIELTESLVKSSAKLETKKRNATKKELENAKNID